MQLVELTVVCTCIGPHKPLTVIMAPRGEPDSIKGNERCWYNQLEYCRMDQDNECPDRIFRYWVQQSLYSLDFCKPILYFFGSLRLHVDMKHFVST